MLTTLNQTGKWDGVPQMVLKCCSTATERMMGDQIFGKSLGTQQELHLLGRKPKQTGD